MIASTQFHHLIKSQFLQNKSGWKKSFVSGMAQDEQGSALPWMTYPFIEFIEQKLNQTHSLFEFGCGTSTLFFARRAKRVVSLETNPQWFKIVSNLLIKHQIKNVELILMEDGLQNPAYENYAESYSARLGTKFDFIVIDSLKRFTCCRNSIAALSENGAIVLDDSERTNYRKTFNFFATIPFEEINFYGIEPGRLRIKGTTLFTKK